jgi:hypothetical protein
MLQLMSGRTEPTLMQSGDVGMLAVLRMSKRERKPGISERRIAL